MMAKKAAKKKASKKKASKKPAKSAAKQALEAASKELRGRPTKYSRDIADYICIELRKGRTVNAICRQDGHIIGVLDPATVRGWAAEDVDGFYTHYARARDVGVDAIVEDCFDIADDGTNDWMEREDPENPGWVFNGDHFARSRLRVDTRKWYASKMAPKRYGDRLALTDGDGKPLQVAPIVLAVLPDDPDDAEDED